MGKKAITCGCGGTFDENGICENCGKERPRSGGYRVLHSTLCVIGALIVLFCLSSTLSMRHYLEYHNISGGLQNSRLSDFKIPFSGGQTVTEYIRREYVMDENVLPQDIADAVDAMNITGYLAGKATEMGAMLRGESEEYPTVTSDEIITLLENSEEMLYSKCMLVIEDSDKDAIRAELDAPLTKLNGTAKLLYGSKFGRALAHFRVGKLRIVLDFVLLGLLLWRWIVIRKRCGKSATGAVRGMGWVFLIPSAISLIATIVTGLQMGFKGDDVVSMYTLVKGIRQPHWLYAPLGVAFGILLITLAGYLRARALAPKPAKKPAAPRETVRRERPAERTAPRREAQPAPAPRKAEPAAEGKACIFCGKEIPATAMFCIYCGNKQRKAADPTPEQPEVDLLKEFGIASVEEPIEPETAPETAAGPAAVPDAFEAPIEPEMQTPPVMPEKPEKAVDLRKAEPTVQEDIPESPMKAGMRDYLRRLEAESDADQG